MSILNKLENILKTIYMGIRAKQKLDSSLPCGWELKKEIILAQNKEEASCLFESARLEGELSRAKAECLALESVSKRCALYRSCDQKQNINSNER